MLIKCAARNVIESNKSMKDTLDTEREREEQWEEAGGRENGNSARGGDRLQDDDHYSAMVMVRAMKMPMEMAAHRERQKNTSR